MLAAQEAARLSEEARIAAIAQAEAEAAALVAKAEADALAAQNVGDGELSEEVEIK